VIDEVIKDFKQSKVFKESLGEIRKALLQIGVMQIKENYVTERGEQIRLKKQVVSTLQSNMNKPEIIEGVRTAMTGLFSHIA